VAGDAGAGERRARPGPVGGPRDENRRARTAALLESALTQMCAVGVEAVTIDDIVGAVSMAKGNFYRYFDSKEALVEVAFDPLRTALVDASSRCAASLRRARSRRALSGLYMALAFEVATAVAAHPLALTLYLQEARGPDRGARAPICALARDVERAAIELAELAAASGLVRDRDSRFVALIVVGAAEKLLCAQRTSSEPFDAALAAQTLIEVVLDGVRAPARRRRPSAPAG